jgi:hypothetical protein
MKIYFKRILFIHYKLVNNFTFSGNGPNGNEFN